MKDDDDSAMEDFAADGEVKISPCLSNAAGDPDFAEGRVIVSMDGLVDTTGVAHLIRVERDALHQHLRNRSQNPS